MGNQPPAGSDPIARSVFNDIKHVLSIVRPDVLTYRTRRPELPEGVTPVLVMYNAADKGPGERFHQRFTQRAEAPRPIVPAVSVQVKFALVTPDEAVEVASVIGEGMPPELAATLMSRPRAGEFWVFTLAPSRPFLHTVTIDERTGRQIRQVP